MPTTAAFDVAYATWPIWLVVLHQCGSRAIDMESAGRVDCEHALERGGRERPVTAEELAGGCDTGAGDRKVQTAHPFRGLADSGVHGGLAGHIASSITRGLAERANRQPAGLVLHVEERDPAACSNQSLSGREPESRGTAGDDCPDLIQLHSVSPADSLQVARAGGLL